MPKSAIDTGLVDYVLPVEKMGPELLDYVKHPYVREPREILRAEEKLENDLQKIFMLIRSGTGHDFSHYKRNTMYRRILRRMAVHQLENIGDYVRYLQGNAGEVKMLFKDLLITVTNFFRDAKAFEALGEKVIMPMVDEKAPGAIIRVWIPGCATGEEAFSVAILFSEAMETLKKHFDIQIFATDMNAAAIDCARHGVYPESIVADVSEERLKKFFVKNDNSFTVKKQIREMVVFATQDIAKDAPFSKLDLVCCRNVLIYLDTALQKKILPLFHYTLKPGGFLFLGTSETIGDFADRFSPVDVKWRIFKHKGMPVSRILENTAASFYNASAVPPVRMVELVASNIRQVAEKAILQDYAPPCVLVDEKFDIQYFHGETDRYLKLPEGEPTFNILKMAPDDLVFKLRTLLQKASQEKEAVIGKGLIMRHNNKVMTVNLVLRQLSIAGARGKFIMVMFEEVAEKQKGGTIKKRPDGTADPRIAALEQELQSTREYLQTAVEELETSNEELKSTNEELQSTNEEMQSSNEELETSREELQSSNEELTTVNTEIQGKIEELTDVNNDLYNILSSARVGTIFLDTRANIKRFTPSAKHFFKLIDSDAGRSIDDIVHNLKYESMSEDINKVLCNLSTVEKELETKNNSWVFMRIIPYRTSENIIEGVVLTFFDITEQKKADLLLKHAKDFAEGIIETMLEPLVVLDDKLRITTANKAFYEKFMLKPAETLNKLIYELGDWEWDIPEFKKLLESILPEKTVFNNFRVEQEFHKIGRRVMLLNARQIFHEGAGAKSILLAMEDVTDRKA
jgi:two-component system CheB/CheR fusion protein